MSDTEGWADECEFAPEAPAQWDLLSAGAEKPAHPDSGERSVEDDVVKRGPESDLARRVRLKFSADEGFLAKLRRAKELLCRKYPSGRLEFLIDEAMEAFLEKRDPMRRILRRRKRQRSRL